MGWRPGKALIRLREQINETAPNRSKGSDGTIGDAAHAARTSDHNPWVTNNGVGIVTAIDITHDPDHGCNAEVIVQSLIQSKDRRIKYIIWNHKIVSSVVKPWKWRAYTGTNPHTRHFHLSVHPEEQFYDSTDRWGV